MTEADVNIETTDDIEAMAADLDAESGVTDDEESTEEEPTSDEAIEEVGDEVKIKVGDKEFTATEILEFQQGYMRQDDYTKKTQEVATARREIEEAMQKQVVDDYYNQARPQPTAAPDGNVAITDDDLALMEPEVRRVYEVSKANAEKLAAIEAHNNAIEAQNFEREKAEQGRYLNNMLNGVYEQFKADGMSEADAGNAAADVFKTIRVEKLGYTQEAIDRVLASNKTIDVDAIRKETLAEYRAEKEKDATAGLAGASANDAPITEMTPVEMDEKDPEKLLRSMADSLGTIV